MVRNQEVVIVDEHTGRAMPGRRWSDGIHQQSNQRRVADTKREPDFSLDHVPKLFPPIRKVIWHDWTADTEAFEFNQIYGLDVVVIPTHKPMVRDDQNDLIYRRYKKSTTPSLKT